MSDLDVRVVRDLFGEASGATFSRCGKYRYHLWRRLCDVPSAAEGEQHKLRAVAFIMLNPSDADESAPDPTVTRCINFARDWGYQRLDVLNLFAYRSPYPKDLLIAKDPVGHPDNDRMILWLAQNADLVCAWGSQSGHVAKLIRERSKVVRQLLGTAELYALRVSKKSGQPWHPLYLPGTLKMEAFA